MNLSMVPFACNRIVISCHSAFADIYRNGSLHKLLEAAARKRVDEEQEPRGVSFELKRQAKGGTTLWMDKKKKSPQVPS